MAGELESDTEWETDSEEEGFEARQLLKPKFVGKNERDTIAERERMAQEEEVPCNKN